MNPNKNFVYPGEYSSPNVHFLKSTGMPVRPAPVQYVNPAKSRLIQRIKKYTTGVDQFFANPDQPSLSPQPRNNHFTRQVYHVVPRNYSPNVRFTPPSHFNYFKPVAPSYPNSEIPVQMHKRGTEMIQPNAPIGSPNLATNSHSNFYTASTFQGNLKGPLGYSGQPRYFGGPAQGVFGANKDFMLPNPQNSEIYRSKSSTVRSRGNLPENSKSGTWTTTARAESNVSQEYFTLKDTTRETETEEDTHKESQAEIKTAALPIMKARTKR